MVSVRRYQTVLEETKKNSLAAYRRLRKLLQDETKAFVFLANDHHSETFIEKVRFHHDASKSSMKMSTHAFTIMLEA